MVCFCVNILLLAACAEANCILSLDDRDSLCEMQTVRLYLIAVRYFHRATLQTEKSLIQTHQRDKPCLPIYSIFYCPHISIVAAAFCTLNLFGIILYTLNIMKCIQYNVMSDLVTITALYFWPVLFLWKILCRITHVALQEKCIFVKRKL